MNLRRADSHWRRRKSRIQAKDWGNFSACSISASDGHFWSYPVFVSFSHSSSSSSQFWIMFSRVWLEGDAPGRCKSGEGCWHRGKLWRTSNEKAVSISEGAAAAEGGLGSVCVCEDAECFGSQAFGLSTCKPCQKCPKMSPGWVQTGRWGRNVGGGLGL